MIFIADSIPVEPISEKREPGAEFVYSDFHEVRDWMQFPMPKNPNFSLNLRVLQGDTQIINGVPQETFIVEYLPLGRLDYDITPDDTRKACEYAQVVAKRNIPIWFDCKDPEIEFMFPHERVIEQYNDALNATILQN